MNDLRLPQLICCNVGVRHIGPMLYKHARSHSVSIVLILIFLSSLPGCERSSQRFIPLRDAGGSDSLDLALDTVTGQTCISASKERFDKSNSPDTPFCTDLYRQSK